MQFVILAAGKGSRFGKISTTKPKCLLKVKNKPIIDYILEALPKDKSEVIIIVKHLSHKIKKHLGLSFKQHPITYIEMGEIIGTAGALWSAKNLLKNKFLVLNSDDIVNATEIKKLISYPLAFGIFKHIAPTQKYLNVVLDKNNYVKKLEKNNTNRLLKINMATGSYVLNRSIFKYQPTLMKNGEYGLPQTIIKMVPKYKIKAVFMPNTITINNRQELNKANQRLI